MYYTLASNALALLLLAATASAESIYGRNSKVLQVTAKTFDEKIKNTYNASVSCDIRFLPVKADPQ